MVDASADMTILEQVSLAPLTAWRIGGPARYLATVRSAHGVRQALEFAARLQLPVWVLGGGSNLLISDAGLAGVVIRMRDTHMDIVTTGSGSASVEVGAGAPMAKSVRQLVAAGWQGLEWAEGLPGTLGGAVYGNAGCYGGDMAGVVRRVQVWQAGRLEEWETTQMGFAYRTSTLKQSNMSRMQMGMQVADVGPLVVGATLAVVQADPHQLAAIMANTAALRKGKTPQGSSCGSVFKNPPGESAGRLIEAAGLKGYRHGGAQVADKHANYIVNVGGATSADVRAVVAHIQQRVMEYCGVYLEPEVQILGEAW
jgi:UDP-N-acetylmuramate dehydrogenase